MNKKRLALTCPLFFALQEMVLPLLLFGAFDEQVTSIVLHLRVQGTGC